MKSFLSPGWPPRGEVTCIWTPEVRTAGVKRWPAWGGRSVFSTTGLQFPRWQDAVGEGRPAAPQAWLRASEFLRLLEEVVALARLLALTSAAPLAHRTSTLTRPPRDPAAGGSPEAGAPSTPQNTRPTDRSSWVPRVLCASQVAEEARGAHVFVCHPVDSLRGRSDNEGECAYKLTGACTWVRGVCVWLVDAPVGGGGWM